MTERTRQLTWWGWKCWWARQCRNLSDSQRSFSASGASLLHSSRSIGTRRNTCRRWAWEPRKRYRWSHIWGTPPHSRSTAVGQGSYSYHLPSHSLFWDFRFNPISFIWVQKQCYEFTCSSRTTFSGWNPKAHVKQSMQRNKHRHTQPNQEWEKEQNSQCDSQKLANNSNF